MDCDKMLYICDDALVFLLAWPWTSDLWFWMKISAHVLVCSLVQAVMFPFGCIVITLIAWLFIYCTITTSPKFQVAQFFFISSFFLYSQEKDTNVIYHSPKLVCSAWAFIYTKLYQAIIAQITTDHVGLPAKQMIFLSTSTVFGAASIGVS